MQEQAKTKILRLLLAGESVDHLRRRDDIPVFTADLASQSLTAVPCRP